MLLVNTYLAPSGVHGIGLFAGEDITLGTVIWRFTPQVDLMIGAARLRRLCASLGKEELRFMCSYLYKRGGRYFLVSDNTRFINHSETGHNVALIDDFTEVAVTDIPLGTELMENYYLNYDMDDLFCFEMQNLDPAGYLSLTAKEKRRFVKGQNVPR